MNQNQPQQFNVVNNQTNAPGEESRIKEAIRSNSVYLRCYHCGNEGLTVTDKTCSCGNICCCLWFSPIIWVLFQACRHKDMNCYDAVHKCARCNKEIGVYQAC